MARGKPFAKGNKGKPKGAKNKITKTVKQTFGEVFNELQDDPKANLLEWGKKNPGMFYQIASKLIPTEVQGKMKNSGIIKVVRE